VTTFPGRSEPLAGSRANIAWRHHDFEDRARPVKVVVAGPFSAGKTTLITTISEVAVLSTERKVTDHSGAIKAHTTVALDFGRISFANGASIHIFGTPGQRRFEDVWGAVADGMVGLVLLVHADDERSAKEARSILDVFRRYADVPFCVGVTHLDRVFRPPSQVIEQVRALLDIDASVPVLACDPRRREDVKVLLLRIFVAVQARLHQAQHG
jgi:signal recognition particle receptor subunit beta